MDMRTTRSARTSRRFAVLLMIVVALGLVTAGVAYAATIFEYSGSSPLNPGGFYATSGENYRLHNRACRTGNSGQMKVQYIHLGSVVQDSGSQFTNCPDVFAALETDGTFTSKCINTGTVAFTVYCQTTRP